MTKQKENFTDSTAISSNGVLGADKIKVTKDTFTRQEVIDLVEKILQYPDPVIDAVSNEWTNWDAESLIELAEG